MPTRPPKRLLPARVAISDRRILDVQDAGVTFRYRHNTRGQQTMALDGVEFLRRFLLHVLPTNFVRIRYFGLLGNRSRANNLERCRELIAAAPGAARLPTANANAKPERAQDEPHRCPVCSVGRLLCVGVIVPEREPDLHVRTPVARDTS